MWESHIASAVVFLQRQLQHINYISKQPLLSVQSSRLCTGTEKSQIIH